MLGIAATLAFFAARPAASAVVAQPAPHTANAIQINAVVERPAVAPMLISRPAQTVVVRAGQTVESLASEYSANAAVIRWANGLPYSVEPGAGAPVLIPPGPGALVRVKRGETPTAFAGRLGIDPRVVLDYNALNSDAPLSDGIYLQVPEGAAPVGALIADRFVVATPGVPAVSVGLGGDTFPYGQCTWYVASRRAVDWGGNAVAWWWIAARVRPEGHMPVQGAIVVFRIGWTGHVGYIEHVNADDSFVMSEMNYYVNGGGWGRVDRRTIAPNDGSILGFIY